MKKYAMTPLQVALLDREINRKLTRNVRDRPLLNKIQGQKATLPVIQGQVVSMAYAMFNRMKHKLPIFLTGIVVRYPFGGNKGKMRPLLLSLRRDVRNAMKQIELHITEAKIVGESYKYLNDCRDRFELLEQGITDRLKGSQSCLYFFGYEFSDYVRSYQTHELRQICWDIVRAD